MGRIIQGDPTAKELNQPPENRHEADVQFYTPSARFRGIAEFIDKDIVLAHLGIKERRELILIIRILLSAIKLEDSKGWLDRDNKPNREISTYWLQRLVATAVTSRAIDGEAAKLSKTLISDERLQHNQNITMPKQKNAFDLVRPGGGGNKV